MEKDTTDLLERLRQSASETDEFVRGMTDISCEVCEMAADTIERQAKEIAEFNTEANRLVAINRALIRERDAALAEIRSLKMVKPGVAERCSSCGEKILPDHVVLCQDCRA